MHVHMPTNMHVGKHLSFVRVINALMEDKHCYSKYVWESWHLYCQWFCQLQDNDQAQTRFQWAVLSMQQHLTLLDRAWQSVAGKAMHEVYLYELEMYLAKVEAEAVERELKEALKRQEELEKKKKDDSQGTTGVIGKVGHPKLQ